jgi:16S rRNA (uracil1498-N3)-methyltransferase
VALPDGARRHLTRVLRLRPGDPVELVDGKGGLAHGVLAENDSVRIESREPEAAPELAPVWLAVAMPRLPRLEWLIEKCCELGVARVHLLRTRHGERDVGDKRVQRLQRIADEALLQCRRLRRMEVRAPAGLEDTLAPGAAGAAGAPGGAAIWLASPPEGGTPAPPPARDGRPLWLLVGPEGGFSPEEIALARAAGATSVSLGDNVLRVETAAVAMAVLAAV